MKLKGWDVLEDCRPGRGTLTHQSHGVGGAPIPIRAGSLRMSRRPTHLFHLSPLLLHSFQLTVEMFDYMDCELKLSESGEL